MSDSTAKVVPDAGDDELLSADDIISAEDIYYEFVHVPEWKNKRGVDRVRVKALTATERDAFESSMIIGSGKTQRLSTADIRAKLVARCIVNSAGVRMFGDEQIAVLGLKSAAAMDRVYEVAARLSKISQSDVDELAGKSESPPVVVS